MAERTQQRQNLPTPPSVVVILPPGAQLMAAIGVIEALDAANRISVQGGRAPLYRVAVVGVQERTPSVSGPVLATGLATEVAQVHTLIVAGSLDVLEEPVHPGFLREVERLSERAERVVGVCMGAFALATLGLLDGRRCTTHWLGVTELQRRIPTAVVEPDALYVQDGPVFTSAGATAAIDLALQLIRLDAGPRLAVAVARALVMFAHRSGGQSQFGTALRIRPGLGERLQQVVMRILDHPGEDHRVEVLAAAAGMSPRNFARRFKEQAGQTPAAFVTAARLEASQRALTQSDAGLETVAADCGFGSVDSLRRAFRRRLGVTPAAYRARFRGGAPADHSASGRQISVRQSSGLGTSPGSVK